jgi:AraC-like DNA-binding protein
VPARQIPVYGLTTDPAGPRVVVQRLDDAHTAIRHGDHAHDFFVLAYIDDAAADMPVRAGDLFVVAPGDVVGAAAFGLGERGLSGVSGWSVMFDAELLGAAPAASPLAWGTHPLLSPFVGGRRPGIARLSVAAAARPAWVARIRALDDELRERRGGHHAAAAAHLTLMLVDVARLGDGVLSDLELNREPLLGEVFAVIERRFAGPLSLREVASEVGISAGHLTTRVRERTGRTVLEWITDRRLVEARRLLATTDLPVATVAAAVGVTDPGYFARIFRRAHGVSPAAWRGRVGPAVR